MRKERKVLMVFGGMAALAAVVFAGEPSALKTQPATNSIQSKAVAPSGTNAAASKDLPVIGYVEKNDRTITIKSGPKGALYTVKTKSGKVLCENLSVEQLRAQAPEVHEFIKTAIAGASGKGGAATDASVRAISDSRTR